ncbi:hypothetical protein ACJMK2_003172 [Sinanodonta woodiana]|uniref:Uncharacterized protein n=1 Tax=Sinanodonta woodiana TaxID=1069815 RepID=A0ABD3XXK8_SINWO
MWLFEMKIQMIESDIKQKQAISYQDMPVDLSTAADTCVIRNTGQFDEGSKFQQRVDYLKQQLLLKLHTKEAEITTITNLPHSLCEIEYRQENQRVSHMRDDVFLFFVKLKLLSIEVSRRKLSSPWIKYPYIR